MIVPASCWVWALNALQNSMMFTPCWPSAGPTGGAGFAAPAWICSLIIAVSFFLGGIFFSSSGWWIAGGQKALDVGHLAEPELHRGLTTEDRHQQLYL